MRLILSSHIPSFTRHGVDRYASCLFPTVPIFSQLISVSVLFLLLLLGTCVNGHTAGSPFVQWWDDPKIIEAVHLTDEQRQKIAAIVEQSQKKRKELTEQLAPLRRVIPELLNQAELDEPKVMSTLKTQQDIRWARVQDTVAMRISVRKVLSAEQFKKLHTLYPLIMQRRWVTRQLPVRATAQPTQGTDPTAQPEEEEDEEGE